MKKSTLCFGAIVLATGLCAAPLGFAAPEETVASTAEQPSAADTVQAVHTAEFTDAQGNSVKVVPFLMGASLPASTVLLWLWGPKLCRPWPLMASAFLLPRLVKSPV